MSKKRAANGSGKAKEKKIYLLDTSVLLHSPEALFAFGDNDVVLPLVVLDELDTFKKGSMELNRNARWVISQLDELRTQGPVDQGVALGQDGGTLRVDVDQMQKVDALIPPGFSHNVDNRILATALGIKHQEQKRKVVLVTKDINMRVKAEALGLVAEDYRHDQIVEISEMYPGHREVTTSDRVLHELYEQKTVPISAIDQGPIPLAPHEFVMLRASGGAITKYDGNGHLHQIRDLRHDVWGLRPLNREQRYALEVLLDDSIPLVTIAGKAGTGKTILAIAVGLQKVCNEKTYRKLAIYRPVIPMGRDLGYLPGTEQEKLSPWMQPIYDNLEYLLSEGGAPQTNGGSRKGGGGGGSNSSRIDYLQDSNLLDIRALAYIRGRSLPQQFIIVDEAQNLTPHEAKTIITRAGQGTKLVFTGDPYQIDHPYLDSTSNGLTHVVEKFKDHGIAAHVTLVKGERSPLAEIASQIMEN